MSAISTDVSAASNSIRSATDGFGDLKSEDFLNIIITELSRQDPLSPSDTSALLDQMATIWSIESDIELTDNLQTMVRQNEITSAGSLVGQFVTGLSDSAVDVAGYVDSVSITREGVTLNLSGGFKVPMENIAEIIDPELIDLANEQANGGGAGGSGGGGDDGDGDDEPDGELP